MSDKSTYANNDSAIPAPGALLAEHEIIPEDQAAREVHRSPTTLRRWRQLGCGPPFIQIGREFHYSRGALAGWLLNGGMAVAEKSRQRNSRR